MTLQQLLLSAVLATLALDLPQNTEAAMILVACCPGGSLSNVVTHFGRGNTALSVSISAVAALMALLLTPLNFTWMVSTNPATAGWLRTLNTDASAIWWSLLALLAVPMILGLAVTRRMPVLIASLWGIWHIVSGMTLATLWRRKDARLGD